MASRIIAQLLVVGGGYVVRAFAEAYRQALANTGQPGAGPAAAAAAAAARHKLSADEARKILGVSSNAGLRDIAARYERMYHANDPAKGGSAYLQAKVASAKHLLESEAVARGEKVHADDAQKKTDGD